MDGSNQRVLFGKEEKTRLPMASTTKIMTCLYALEHGNLSDTVTFSENAARAPKVHLGAPVGSRFLLSDLLYSLMLESDNDAAVAIAEHIGGSVDAFCAAMTAEARDYGCFDTSFITPNGLDDPDHYTTCYDLALLTCRAIQNPTFRHIISEESCTIKELDSGTSYHLQNRDTFLTSYPGAIGVKTGFTSGAGYCFVGAVEQKDHFLISVVLGCGWPPNRSWKWKDTRTLMDYGIASFSSSTLVLNEEIPERLPIDYGQKATCRISGPTKTTLLLSKEESITINTDLPSVLTAPVQKGETIGAVHLYINDILYRTYPIRTEQTVPKINYFFCFREIWGQFLFL